MTDRRTLLAAALAAGVAPALLRAAAPAREADRFACGIASGTPRSDGMVLWTRLTGEGLPEAATVRWEVAEDERFTKIVARGDERAEQADAHTVHAEATGLTPDRWYWYRFHALGVQSPAGRTRTVPAADAAVARLDLVLASCQRWDVGHYAAWRHAAQEELDAVIFVGDYIYESPSPRDALRRHEGGTADTLEGYRARYAQYKSDPLLQAAHARCPWLVTWDDHEVQNDYAGLQGPRLEPEFPLRRAAAYRAWWEHMPLPKAARPRGPDARIVTRLDWGRLARLHLLDGRQFRDPQACQRPGEGGGRTLPAAECEMLGDPKRSLLGLDQERWLADGWDTARRWNIVAQQTLMARFSFAPPASRTAWTDGWDGYAPARRRLLEGIAERKLGGAVVLSGDVHAHYAADLKTDFDDEKASPVATEFCGTSITSLALAQDKVDAALRYNPHVHFGRSDRRGYVRLAVDGRGVDAQMKVLDDARDAKSAISTAARFAVEHGRPGVQRA